jgi:hypothetical protein
MAILLTERPKNLTEYPNSFKRQGAFPLDSTNCWYSLDEALSYAANDKTAYVGQIITVIENRVVKHYTIINEEGYVQEIGSGSSGGSATQTFESLEDAQRNIFTLSRGQIITIVNNLSASAYIVNYDKTGFIPINTYVVDADPVQTENVTSIITGDYQPTGVISENGIQEHSLSSILNGEYEPTGLVDPNAVPATSINDILEGTYKEATV